jgi:GNAT superfamily N-acetyltransferase
VRPLYTLRSAQEEDFEFLVKLDVLAMREYVERAWGFSYQRQRAYIRESFVPEISRIIVVEGQPAGYLYVNETTESVKVVDLKLMPAFQGRGIGRAILAAEIAAAAAKGLPLTLSVLKVNPARQLYERLGFRVFGENETDLWLRREVSGGPGET